jgi:hypothetical protein
MPLAVIVLVCLLVLPATPAHAYLDPGSGSMMLQLLLGGVAGAGVILKLYWGRLKAALGLGKPAKDEATGSRT